MKRIYSVLCILVFAIGIAAFGFARQENRRRNQAVQAEADPSSGLDAVDVSDAYPSRAAVVTYLVTRIEGGVTTKRVRTRYISGDGTWKEVTHGQGTDLVFSEEKEGARIERVQSGAVQGMSAQYEPLEDGIALASHAPSEKYVARVHSPAFLSARSNMVADSLLGFTIYGSKTSSTDDNGITHIVERWYAAEVGAPLRWSLTLYGSEGTILREFAEATKVEFFKERKHK